MNIADLFAKLRIVPDQKSFDATDKAIGAVKSALAGLAAYAGVHALKGFVEETIEAGGHINDLAQETSVSTDELQELGYVAGLNSSSMDEVGHSMVKLQKNMEAARKGGQEQAKAFSDLGVKTTDASGKLRPAADVFKDIAVSQRAMTDESKRTNAGMATLGRGFNKLLPTMNQIADEGFDHLKQEAHDLGAVMDGEAIASLDELGDTQDKVKASLTGLRNEAVITMIPVLKEMLDGLLEWVKANRKIIAQKLEFVLRGLAKIIQVVAFGIGKLIDVLEYLGNNMGLVLAGVVAVGAAFLILKGQAILAAVASAASWVLASLPLVLLVAAIAAAILIFDDLITAFQGGDSVIEDFLEKRMGVEFVDTMKRVAGAIGAAFEAVFDYLKVKIEWLLNAGERLGEIFFNLTHDTNEDKIATRKFFTRQFGKAIGDEYAAGANIDGIDSVNVDSTKTVTAERVTTSVAPTFNVTLNGAGATSENMLAVTDHLDEWWGNMMRTTATGVGGVK